MGLVQNDFQPNNVNRFILYLLSLQELWRISSSILNDIEFLTRIPLRYGLLFLLDILESVMVTSRRPGPSSPTPQALKNLLVYASNVIHEGGTSITTR